MSGIVEIYSHEKALAVLYDSLIHLPHRGQDAADILACNEIFFAKHGLGISCIDVQHKKMGATIVSIIQSMGSIIRK